MDLNLNRFLSLKKQLINKIYLKVYYIFINFCVYLPYIFLIFCNNNNIKKK